VDGVIVPSARPARYLREALYLAAELGSPLVVLCSKEARADEAVRMARGHPVEVIAVDVHSAPRFPFFETSALLENTKFARRTDTSAKRNLGLAIAKIAQWERVLFLDDDIVIDSPDDVGQACGLLDTYDAVGLTNRGFPDNSVVCHAYRAVGERQECFVGAGAMTVATSRVDSFFPSVYNEDWFFLLNDARLRPVAMTGSAIQKPYDPFASPSRARSEEFGDCLAEGLYALLHHGRRVRDADLAYWRTFLASRRQLIEQVIAKIPSVANLGDKDKARMRSALKAAQQRRNIITPESCVAYLRAWRADRGRWQRFRDGLPTKNSAHGALAWLGLVGHHGRPSPASSAEAASVTKPRRILVHAVLAEAGPLRSASAGDIAIHASRHQAAPISPQWFAGRHTAVHFPHGQDNV
jgi:hypothetical protein